MEEQAKNYLLAILGGICKRDVSVEATTDDRGILLMITAAKEDMGRIIGKGGQTVLAIRRLCRQYGLAGNTTVSIKINEP